MTNKKIYALLRSMLKMPRLKKKKKKGKSEGGSFIAAMFFAQFSFLFFDMCYNVNVVM